MSLKAELREKVGSGSAKKVREAGLVPATLYGKGSEAVSLTVNRRELDVVLKTQGLSQAFELEFDGKKENFVVKAVNKAALADEIYSVDFKLA